MQGGTGSGADNKANILVLADFSVNSGTNATQTINVTGGGSIEVTGGSNAAGASNNAGIYAAATGAGGASRCRKTKAPFLLPTTTSGRASPSDRNSNPRARPSRSCRTAPGTRG